MAEPLKLMFSSERMKDVSSILKKNYSSFPDKQFLAHFKTKKWEEAELKSRVKLIAEALHDCLPPHFPEAVKILIPASEKMRWGYFSIFFPEFVERYGMDHWEDSMKAFEIFTQGSSAEFAIRPFIVKDEKRAMKQMMKWSKSSNHHVRRLASEGCRPRLPWGMKLQAFVKNPKQVLEILENLKNDPELYVRKSVANNLNDISKDNPALALKTAKAWLGKSEHTDWIVNHAMRGLLKSGNKDALKLFGHEDGRGMEVESVTISAQKIKLGEALAFSIVLKNTRKTKAKCRIEYAVDYVKSNGKHSRKVFQLAKKELAPGLHTFKKSQRFQDFTTRKHYAGKHNIAVLVNGNELASIGFHLTL